MNTTPLPLHSSAAHDLPGHEPLTAVPVTPEPATTPVVSIFQKSSFPLAGGCHCGAVRYTLRAAARSVVYCHCSICRRVHGALSVAHALIERRNLTIDKGVDDLTTYESSQRIHRKFCRVCGSSLFFEVNNAPNTTYIAAATLDDGAHPGHRTGNERHAYVGSKATWEHIDARLLRFITVELDTIDEEDAGWPERYGHLRQI